MDWNIVTVALLTVGVIASIFHGEPVSLFTVVNTFNCTNTQAAERILFSSPCGAISSPCYPQSISGLRGGVKSWEVQSGTKNRPVAGYRITMHDFHIDDDAILSIGKSAKTSDSGILKVSGEITMKSDRTSENGIIVTKKGKGKVTKLLGDTFDVDFPEMHLTFKSMMPNSKPGFSFTFCADFDQCAAGIGYCKNGGTCVRKGFKKYGCNCKSGFSGTRCEIVGNQQCTAGACDPNASCATSGGSTVCECKSGFTGRGRPGECIDIDECATGWHACADGEKCTNIAGGFECTDENGHKRPGGFEHGEFDILENKPEEESTCERHPTARHRACETGRCVGSRREFNRGCVKPIRAAPPADVTSGISSYMSLPRVNFGGGLNFDAATINNKKCVFENEYFTVSEMSTNFIGVSQETSQYNRFPFASSNWNPDGSNRFSFPNASITSICTTEGCGTSEDIVGAVFRGTSSAAIVDLDVDQQDIPEVWGLTVYIPGMLKGKYQPAALQVPTSRNTTADIVLKGYAIGRLGRFKSKLTDIEWESDYYKEMFGSADTLSIRFVMDLYDQFSHMSRITGSIGMTSSDDPLEITGGRILLPVNPTVGPAPVYYDPDEARISIDLSTSIEGDIDGNFHILKNMNVGVIDSTCTQSIEECIVPLTSTPLALEGGEWYNKYGGVVDIDVSGQSGVDIATSRIVVYSEDGSTRTIILAEAEDGIQIGLMNNLAKRLNVGEQADYVGFVTQYGRPVEGAKLEIAVIPAESTTDCSRPTCSNDLSVPLDAIEVSVPPPTDANGQTTMTVKAVKNPDNPRGCGLDGQLYMVRLYYRHDDPIEPSNSGKSTCFFNPDASDADPMKTDCMKGASKIVSMATVKPVVHLYDERPAKDKPTWFDVKDIFVQYHNLFPVMWKNGIIDMHSYEDVVKNKGMLQYSMFDLDVSDPRFMPVTRDLSKSKLQLIKNWMDTGMPYSYPGDPSGDDFFSCEESTLGAKIAELQTLGEAAIITELSTIPTYVTAWLSLQTEYGRNVEAAEIMKSVFVEEMLHMSLAANFINSVGGRVNLTSMALLPQYPTPLGSGTFFDLMPGVYVTIERLTTGLARDLFAKIETPATAEEQAIFHSIAELWQVLAAKGGDKNQKPQSKNMQYLLNDYQKVKLKRKSNLKSAINKDQTPMETWQEIYDNSVNYIKELSSKPTNTIGAFYLRVMLFAGMLESCTQMNALQGSNASPTIFTGDVDWQADMDAWHNPEDQTDSSVKSTGEPTSIPISSLYTPLFPIVNLQKAVEAIIEIVYQGEGGSQCTPFITEPTADDPFPEKSHYYRFLEIAHQKQIVKMTVSEGWNAGLICMNLTGLDCSNDLQPGENYCYGGPAVPLREDGVWPLVSNPQNGMYKENTKAWKDNLDFNRAYTTLLQCLENGFGGNPDEIKGCYSYMYQLTIMGKRLVSTPIGTQGDTNFIEKPCKNCHASPTWTFLRELTYRAGFPLQG